jgi:hypothetical protein
VQVSIKYGWGTSPHLVLLGHKLSVRFNVRSGRILRTYDSTAWRNASREGDLCTPSLGGRPETAGGGNL